MRTRPIPDREYLNECFIYEPKTGGLFWRERPECHFQGDKNRSAAWVMKWWNTRFAGKKAINSLTDQGYLSGTIDGRRLIAHRAIFKMFTGLEPELLDHINRDKTDNRIENLRIADKSQNGRNTGLYKTNTTGVKGVSKSSRGGYSASIRISGKRKGRWFPTMEEATAWRAKMERAA